MSVSETFLNAKISFTFLVVNFKNKSYTIKFIVVIQIIIKKQVKTKKTSNLYLCLLITTFKKNRFFK